MDIYEIRQNSITSQIFYNNELTCPDNIGKFFPKQMGENAINYKNRPKISVPITSAILNRIANFTLKGLNVTSTDSSVNSYIQNGERLEDARNIFVNSMVNGTQAIVYKINPFTNKLVLEQWGAEYLDIDPNFSNAIILEYIYCTEDMEIEPILCEDEKLEDDEILMRIVIDEMVMGGIQHNMPFAPFTLMKSLDFYPEMVQYSKPFPMRFEKLVMEYNKILSQIVKNTTILQNVWQVKGVQFENPQSPLRLDADTINYLPDGASLEQVLRNLDNKEEYNLLRTFKENISEASQVPSQLIGLEDVGKIPSGVALQLLFSPLTELVGRFRPRLTKVIKDIIQKSYYIEQGTLINTDSINVSYSNNIVPTDKTVDIALVKMAIETGLINNEVAVIKLTNLIEGI